MKIARDEIDGVVVLRLQGKLTGGPAESEAVGGVVQEAIDSGNPRVLVDLAGVSVVNSTGIGILIVNYTRLRRVEGTIKLLNLSGRVDGVLRMAGLNKIFEWYTDEDEALASFRS